MILVNSEKHCTPLTPFGSTFDHHEMLVDELHTMFDKKSRKQKNRGQITWARKGASIVRQRKHTGDEEEESVPKALLLSPEKSVFLYPNFFCPPNS